MSDTTATPVRPFALGAPVQFRSGWQLAVRVGVIASGPLPIHGDDTDARYVVRSEDPAVARDSVLRGEGVPMASRYLSPA